MLNSVQAKLCLCAAAAGPAGFDSVQAKPCSCAGVAGREAIRAHPLRKLLSLIVVCGLAAGCAGQPVPVVRGDPSGGVSAADHTRFSVPQLATMPVAEADSMLNKAGLVPILRYEPGILSGAGTVVNTEPPAGTLQKIGDKIIVVVAGQPGPTLHDYVDANRELFVGVGVDGNGVLVIGVHQSADLAKEMPLLTQLAGGRPFRLQSCRRTWVDLRRVQVELQSQEALRGATYATALDPLACAVRFTGDLTDAQVAELTARFSGALVIQKGTAARLG